MIGLDTNVLVRYVTQDDPIRVDRIAHHLFTRFCQLGVRGGTGVGFTKLLPVSQE